MKQSASRRLNSLFRLGAIQLLVIFIVTLSSAAQAALTVTNGDFQLPAMGTDSTEPVQLQNWYTAAYYTNTDGSAPANVWPWPLGSGRVMGGAQSQAAEFPPGTWIYQCLGAYDSSLGTKMDWSFTQVIPTDNNGSAGFQIDFYAGDFTAMYDYDISWVGLASLGTFNFNSLNLAGLQRRLNAGTIDLSGLSNGQLIWVRIANTDQDNGGNGWAPIDDVTVSQNFGKPRFAINPAGVTNYPPYAVSLSSLAQGADPINYQWYKISTNGLSTNLLVGAVGATLTMNPVTTTNSGSYFVVAVNSLGSATSSVAPVLILARSSALSVINGDFEAPAVGADEPAFNTQLANWYESGNFPWPNGSARILSGSQGAEFPPNSWLYQCLGAYNRSMGTNLSWSFMQVTPTDYNASGGFKIEFYQQTGSFISAQNVDIDGNTAFAGLSTVSFGSLNRDGLLTRVNSGSVDLSGLADGTPVWVRVVNTGADSGGNGWAPLDGLVVAQNSGSIPLHFLNSPLSQTNYPPYGLSLTAVATASYSIQYQWYHVVANGSVTNVVPGASSSTLTLNPTTAADSGAYFAIATDSQTRATSSVAQVKILARASALNVINGDFESPAVGTGEAANGQHLNNWYESGNFPWPNGSARLYSQSQAAEFPPNSWIYQCLGVYDQTLGKNLSWLFTQVTPTDNNATGGFEIDFYAGTGTFSPSQNVDINGNAALTSIATTSVGSLGKAGLQNRTNSGTLDLSGLADGTWVWIRVANTGGDNGGNGWAPIDNVFVSQNAGLMAPMFTSNPQAQTLYTPYGFTLKATAASDMPFQYQWYHISANGTSTNAVIGATSDTLTVSPSTVADGGGYFVTAVNSLGTATSSVASVQIVQRPDALCLFNGDFELPAVAPTAEGQALLLNNWVSSGNHPWPNGSARLLSLSQASEFPPNTWIYQCVGTYKRALGTNLNWSFVQVTPSDNNASGAFKVDVYAQTGTFISSQNLDIAGNAAFTSLSSSSFNSLNKDGLVIRTNTGTVNLSGLADGTTVWMRVANTGADIGNGWAPLDNVVVSQSSATPLSVKVSYSIGTDGQLQLAWSSGTLLQAPEVTGPWTPVSGASSPFAVVPGQASHMFYRIQVQ